MKNGQSWRRFSRRNAVAAGPRTTELRDVVNAIFYIAEMGC
jgi:hypothetical protein